MKRLLAICLTAVVAFTAVGCGSGAVIKPEKNKDLTMKPLSEVKVAAEDVLVTDEDVESYITSLLESRKDNVEINTEIVTGDTAFIDFVGTKDGVAFEGGTGSKDLVIGSGAFIPGFETGLIGHKAGEVVDLDLAFPDPYPNNEELAGQPVVFTVTINKVTRPIAPELTDEYIVANPDLYDGDASVKDVNTLKTYLKDSLSRDLIASTVFSQLLSGSSLSAYNDAEVATMKEEMLNYYDSMYKYAYGVSLDDYLAAVGYEKDAFIAEVEEYAKEYQLQKAVVFEIAVDNNISVSKEDYDAAMKKQADAAGAESVQAFLSSRTESEIENYKVTILYEKVMDWLGQNIKAE